MEINKTISYKSLTQMARRLSDKPGQVSTRKLAEDGKWVSSVLFTERKTDAQGNLTDDVDFTTLIVKDKEFDQSHQARSWMNERMGYIFPKPAPQQVTTPVIDVPVQA